MRLQPGRDGDFTSHLMGEETGKINMERSLGTGLVFPHS